MIPVQVKSRVGGSVGCGRGPSAFFEGSTHAAKRPPAHPQPSAGGDVGWKHTVPSLHAHLPRDLSGFQSARKACAFPPQSRGGKVHPIAHQVKPAAGCGATPEAMGFLKEFGSSSIWLQTSRVVAPTLFSCRSARHPLGTGGCEIFWVYPLVSILIISRRDACRKHTGPSPHEHVMRNLVKSRSARGPVPAAVVQGDDSRDRASGGAGMVGSGALRKTWSS
jgi:hypothetical protein